MANKKTHEQFEIEMIKKFPDKKYNYLSKYINNSTKIKVQCDKNYEHIWEARPTVLLKGGGCPHCAGNIKWTHEEFVKRFIDKYPNKNFIFLSEYKGMNHKIKVQCNIDPEHIWDSLASSIYKKGSGCPKCVKITRTPEVIKEMTKEFHINNRNKHFEEFKIEMSKKFPDKKYNYLSEYINNRTKIKVQCNVNPEHIWEARPISLLHHFTGCPHCKGNFNKTHEQFEKEYYKKYPFSKIIFLEKYKNINTKLLMQCPCGHKWESTPNNVLNCGSGCPVCNIEQSKAEQEINNLFPDIFKKQSMYFDIEIDLLSHKHKFGIEYNGIVFHSFGKTYPNNINKLDKYKHLRKTETLDEYGYQLFHICESDWLKSSKKKDIWISMISNKLGKSNRIFARKLKIIDLTTYKDFVNNFLEDNHLQGKCNYKFAYGLQNPKTGEVYSIMTFGHSRFDKSIEYELIRFCSYKNFSIIGGASKILKYFEKVHQPKSLISYANRDWSQGNIYKQLGFEFIENTQPNYCYYDNNNNKYSRQTFMKHKLKDKLENFDENLTELENMLNNDYRIYYDTGNMKFIKNYKRK